MHSRRVSEDSLTEKIKLDNPTKEKHVPGFFVRLMLHPRNCRRTSVPCLKCLSGEQQIADNDPSWLITYIVIFINI